MLGTEFQEALRTAKYKLNNPDAITEPSVPTRFSPRSYSNNSILSSPSSGVVSSSSSSPSTSSSSFGIPQTMNHRFHPSDSSPYANLVSSPSVPLDRPSTVGPTPSSSSSYSLPHQQHNYSNRNHPSHSSVGALLIDSSYYGSTDHHDTAGGMKEFSEHRQKYREIKRTMHEETGIKEALYASSSSVSTVSPNSRNGTITTNNSSGGSYYSPRVAQYRQPDHGNIIVNPPDETSHPHYRSSSHVGGGGQRYSPQREAWLGMSPLGSSMDIMSHEQKQAMSNILQNHGRGEIYVNPHITRSPGTTNYYTQSDIGQEIAILKPSRITPNAQRFMNSNGTTTVPPYALQYGKN